MLKLKKLYKKNPRSETGFSLIEVLVAMLIAFFFVLGSMQALVLATAFRVKAQEKQRANQLIQEDIERINLAARDLAVDHSKCGATAYNNGYAQALWNVVEPNPPSSSNLPPTKKLITNKKDDDTVEELGKELGLKRNLLPSNSPYKVLKIQFEVREWNGSNFIDDGDDSNDSDIFATDYIEVIPNAAVQCPK